MVALEQHASHPIARAIIRAWSEPDASGTLPFSTLPESSDVTQTTGGGLAGTVNGARVVVGSPDFVLASSAAMTETMHQAVRSVVRRSHTPVVVAVDGCVTAVLGLGDSIRVDAATAISQLRQLGCHIHIVSGDHEDVVAAVAQELGVPSDNVRGGASPEQKVRYVEDPAIAANVVMVGDGVNDAAALAAATVGIAVHGGAEASLATADVYVGRPGLMPIVELIRAARATVRTIRLSLAVSLCYNVVAAALAISGVIGPLTAAILMPISSFTVVALALASRTFGDEP